MLMCMTSPASKSCALLGKEQSDTEQRGTRALSVCASDKRNRGRAIVSDKFQACSFSSIELPIKYGFKGLLLRCLPSGLRSRNHKRTLKSPRRLKQFIPCLYWFMGSLSGLGGGSMLMGLLRHCCRKADRHNRSLKQEQ